MPKWSSVLPNIRSAAHQMLAHLWEAVSALSIQTKILIPILGILILSLLGSTSGFLTSTSATQSQIVNSQFAEDTARVTSALQQSERDALESGSILTSAIQTRLTQTDTENDQPISLSISYLAAVVRDQFQVDQIVVTDVDGQTRANVAPSHLESLPVLRPDLLINCSIPTTQLVEYHISVLLMTCTPVRMEVTNGEVPYGYVYTMLDMHNLLTSIRRDLELTARPHMVELPQVDRETQQQLLPEQFERITPYEHLQGTRVREITVTLAGSNLPLYLIIDTSTMDSIVSTGLQAMLAINILVALISVVVAIFLTRLLILAPLIRLTSVADEVADGNMSVRPTIDTRDELGRLARVFHRLIEEVSFREERLKQQVRDLQIEIDRSRTESEMEKIKQTKYFQELQQNAQQLREEMNQD